MRYLVVSDNHVDRDILVDLVDRYRSEVDIFFHCGDSELEASDHYGIHSKWFKVIVIMDQDSNRKK